MWDFLDMNDNTNSFVDLLWGVPNIENNKFVTSLNLSMHPLENAKLRTRTTYFSALEVLVNSCASDSLYAKARFFVWRW